MTNFIEFFHVMCGVSVFGFLLTSFLYISYSLKQKNTELLHYAIKTSLLLDRIIFPLIMLQFLTGTFMVRHHQLSFHTPWIIVAYLALSMVSLCALLLVVIKYRNRHEQFFHHKKLFYFLNILLIIIFCLIIHDAITQQTWLGTYMN